MSQLVKNTKAFSYVIKDGFYNLTFIIDGEDIGDIVDMDLDDPKDDDDEFDDDEELGIIFKRH